MVVLLPMLLRKLFFGIINVDVVRQQSISIARTRYRTIAINRCFSASALTSSSSSSSHPIRMSILWVCVVRVRISKYTVVAVQNFAYIVIMYIRCSVSHPFRWDFKYLTIQALLTLLSSGNYGCINNSLAHCFTTSKLYNNFCVCACVNTVEISISAHSQLKCKLLTYIIRCQKLLMVHKTMTKQPLNLLNLRHRPTDRQAKRLTRCVFVWKVYAAQELNTRT